MFHFHKTFTFLIVSAMMLTAGCGSQGSTASPQNGASDYPKQTITGVIPWGAGGDTDTISRAIAPLAEKNLGQSIVLSNKTGANGAIGLQYVMDKKSDGYHLLFTAENAASYGVLDISKSGFEDLYPINIMAGAIPAIIVSTESPYHTIDDLIQETLAKPGKVKMGSTGQATMDFIVSTMLTATTNVNFNMVPFEGGGPALTAVLGGHVDVTVTGLTAALENMKAGKVRILAVINEERVEQAKDVPSILESVPDMKRFLPWGPFYGVWIKEDTPDEIKQKLVAEFAKAQQDPEFQDFLKQRGAVSLGLSGDEAIKFWKDWQSTTAWLLQDAGVAKVNPEELGIKRKE